MIRPKLVRAENLAEHGDNLLGVVQRLIRAVHNDRDPTAVRKALDVLASLIPPDGFSPAECALVALAALVDPDRPVAELAAWLATVQPAAWTG